MEPSQDLASAEEFNGSESGWTTYIGSPIHSEIYNDDEQSVDMDEYGNHYKKAHENIDDDKGVDNDDNDRDTEDEESDDSMASDASSGPSHLQLVCINSEGSHEKIPSAKRPTKQVRKTKYEGLVAKEEESLLLADSAASHVSGGARYS